MKTKDAEIVGLVISCPFCGLQKVVRVSPSGAGTRLGNSSATGCNCGAAIIGGWTSTGLAFGRGERVRDIHESSGVKREE